MFQKLLITTYIVLVLIIANFARAETIQISSVTFNPQDYTVHIKGYDSNSCTQNIIPRVQSVLPGKGHDLVFIEVSVSENTQESCISVEPRLYYFELVFNMKTLGLLPYRNYSVSVINSNQSLNEDFSFYLDSEMRNFPFSSYTTFGILKQIKTINEDVFALETSKGLYIVNTKISLSKYVGKRVNISGHVFAHQGGPINIFNSDNEFLDKSSLFLSSISAFEGN